MSKNQTPQTTNEPIIFFDGVCNLCNRWIDWLLRIDRTGKLKFAPLQGVTAQRFLPNQATQELTTVVFLEEGKIWYHSSAILRSLRYAKRPYSLLRLLLWLPPSWRDFFYRWVAKHRHSLFGARDTCRLPSGDEASRFLP